ncbi:B-cell receptor CD22 [Leptodactylus fuscus]|uniref:B-cell receptor CD22 n=1 Tax=Leptodactylus fuscus TaxID=238119 RepID=UPI003F4E65B1
MGHTGETAPYKKPEQKISLLGTFFVLKEKEEEEGDEEEEPYDRSQVTYKNRTHEKHQISQKCASDEEVVSSLEHKKPRNACCLNTLSAPSDFFLWCSDPLAPNPSSVSAQPATSLRKAGYSEKRCPVTTSLYLPKSREISKKTQRSSIRKRKVSYVFPRFPEDPELSVFGYFIDGEATTIRCSVDHTCRSSPPSLQWNKPGQVIKWSLEISEGSWREVSELTYIPSYEDDGSSLQCKATYPNGQKTERSRTLIIYTAPKYVTVTVITQNGQIMEGTDVTLVCTSISRPEATDYECRWSSLPSAGGGAGLRFMEADESSDTTNSDSVKNDTANDYVVGFLKESDVISEFPVSPDGFTRLPEKNDTLKIHFSEDFCCQNQELRQEMREGRCRPAVLFCSLDRFANFLIVLISRRAEVSSSLRAETEKDSAGIRGKRLQRALKGDEKQRKWEIEGKLRKLTLDVVRVPPCRRQRMAGQKHSGPEHRVIGKTETGSLQLCQIYQGLSEHDSNVNLASSVTAWKGSCAILPCKITSYRDIDNYTWFYNAKYDHTTKDFTGTIIYQRSILKKRDISSTKRVQYLGKTDKDCTILLTGLQVEDSGEYSLRLVDKDTWKWMSKNNLSLLVTDSGTGLKLESIPDIRENKEVTLTCSIDYYCPFYNISLTWLHNVSGTVMVDMRNDRSERSSTKLTFVPTWEDNNKEISCILQGTTEANDTRTVRLDVKYAPKNVQIITESPLIKFVEGDKVTLECSVGSSNPPNPKITWYKNGQGLRLKESKVEFKESGRYYCEATNSAGKNNSNTVEISVLHPPKEIKVQKPVGNTIEGRPVTLNCSTVGNPPVYRYIWYKDGLESLSSTDSRYNISRAAEQDSGFYLCTAYNEQGTSRSEPVQLDIKYAPKDVKLVITPDRKQFLAGSDVTFQCVVNSSNPKVSSITWYKDKQWVNPLNEKKTIGVTDAGKYSCRATNEIGRSESEEVSVEVLYPPKNKNCEILNGNKQKEGEQVTLKCESTQGNPKISSYQWFKSETLYKTTNSDSLQFKNLQESDAGYYSCRATNTIGSSEEIGCNYLTVQYAPKNVVMKVSPGDYVTEYTNVQLNCTARAKPNNQRYILYYNNEPLEGSGKDYVLSNIQMSQEGEYYCIAHNDIGYNKSQVVYIHVSYSVYRIAMYTSAGIASLIAIIIIVVLIVRFRIWLKNCWKTENDKSDSSFFVLKKSTNEAPDQLGQHTSSEDSLTEQINYARLQFPARTNGGQEQPRTKPSPPDPSDIYSIVKKPKSTAEYENIESSKITQNEPQDEIHYSTITNLNKGTVRERNPEVEYAMLKH